MSIQIHPYLLARLVAVQAAFNQPGYKMSLAVPPPSSVSTRKGNNWGAILAEEKKDEGSTGEGEGGGSMKGLRGKQAEYAKAAMRKLGRR